MPLISMRQLLDYAAENDFGMPAFNVNNMEQVHAIMQAADEVDSPVIMQGSAGARSYAGEPFLRHLITAATEMAAQQGAEDRNPAVDLPIAEVSHPEPVDGALGELEIPSRIADPESLPIAVEKVDHPCRCRFALQSRRAVRKTDHSRRVGCWIEAHTSRPVGVCRELIQGRSHGAGCLRKGSRGCLEDGQSGDGAILHV